MLAWRIFGDLTLDQAGMIRALALQSGWTLLAAAYLWLHADPASAQGAITRD